MLPIYDQRMPLGYYDLQKSKPIQSALIEVYLQCGWLIFFIRWYMCLITINNSLAAGMNTLCASWYVFVYIPSLDSCLVFSLLQWYS